MTSDYDEQQLQELLTQIQDLQKQLIQTQKLTSIGALASSITHEFNNILTTIINYARMGVRNKEEAVRDKALDKILNAGLRASRITTGMLSYARGGDNKAHPVCLVPLVNDVLVLVEKDLSIHRIRVETRFEAEPWALMNSGQIQQVLMNLIINARQAMKGGGELMIRVGIQEEDDMGEISIRDNGSGIPKDKLPHIFDAFFSTKERDEQGQGGTGLGLALCRDIMEAHEGRIRVESREGAGTCFTLRFPLLKEPVQSTASVSETT